MLDQKDTFQQRYDQVSRELLRLDLEIKQRNELQKEAAYLSRILEKFKELENLIALSQETKRSFEQEADEQMRELFASELQEVQQKIPKIEKELEDFLIPADPLADRSVFLEIRAGAGGQEAALFAGDLLRMYTNYALTKGWKVDIVDASQTDLGGIREAVLHIQGKDAYAHLKNEAGVHRVQRVPKTETQGRVHTSTATIAILPEAEEVDVNINPTDLRIDTYRAGGAGGQHVNKTDSAVRITHIPTGIAVACQEERSQHKNKAKAFKMLQSRLLVAQQEKQMEEESKKRKEMVGTGMRAEKVRTYNFPQNRITDHQVDLTLKNLDMVMQGRLDDILEALMQKDKEERKKRGLQSFKKS